MGRIPAAATLVIVAAALVLSACGEVSTTPPEVSPAAAPAGPSVPAGAPTLSQTRSAASPGTVPPTGAPAAVTINQAAPPSSISAPSPTAQPTVTPTSAPVPTAAPAPVVPSEPVPKTSPTTTPAPQIRSTPVPTLRITPTPKPTQQIQVGQPPQNQWTGPPECSGDEVTFTSPPIALNEIWFIEPQGKLHGSHVTPTDHTYVNHNQRGEYERHSEAVRAGQDAEEWAPTSDVMSPADGYIVDIDAFPFGPAPYGYTGILEDYRVVIWHTCTVSTIFIHLGGLAPEIVAETGEIGSGGRWSSSVYGAIPVKAGQAVGKAGGQGVDFSVHDTSVPLNGLVIPSHYSGEPWKIYTADPFDYYEGDLKLRMLEKNPRTAEPKGGKIDYDIDGRLVGNWFLDGTVDYSGGSSIQMCGNRPCPYWTGHLSIAYDHVDPTQIRISIGADVGIYEDQCRVCQSVYGVKGNGPDPAGISVASGLVKYDLVAREFTGDLRVETRNLENQVVGVFLVQLLERRSMKMEVIPGRTASQITGFSDAASIYRR